MPGFDSVTESALAALPVTEVPASCPCCGNPQSG